MARYVDAHSHAYEYGEKLSEVTAGLNIVVVIVGDDYETSLRVLELARRHGFVVPCVGLHPWSVNELGREKALREARRIVELALERGVKCFGEIGLDTKFVPESIEAQREVFRLFLEAARDHGIRLNLHTAGTWEEVLRLVQRYDIGYANFHWYTGPLNLLEEIAASGYTISINPAVKIQRKHREVVARAGLDVMLTESDAPYKYRGMELSPRMIPEVVKEIAVIKGLEEGEVAEAVWRNFKKYWG